jgi:regulator of sirC expression with transglutaminase-like and TPR domain
MSVSEIHALIQLIDDPDEGVYKQVREELMLKGTSILPAVLEHRARNIQCEVHVNRLDELVEGLHGAFVKKAIKTWQDSGSQNIFEGALWVHKAANPLLDVEAIKAKYEKFKRDVWLELNNELTALEQVRILNHVFFSEENYLNSKSGHPNPKDALIGDVMDLKTGNPLGLGTLYLAIARDLKLPIHGVNLPNHFILCYCDEHHVHDGSELVLDSELPSGILFYVNPFSKGTIIHPSDVSEFLSHLDLPVDESNCGPCAPIDIIRRLIGNVAYAFERNGEISQAEKMRELLLYIELEATENVESADADRREDGAEG